MRKFKDRSGREWMVDITILTVEKVKAECGIDMPGLFGDRMQPLDALLANPVKLTEVIVACSRDSGSVTELQAEWDGTTADAAVDCWLEELIGFFPDPRKRESLSKLMKAFRETGTQVMELAATELTEGISAHARTAYEMLKKASLSANESGESSGISPATSDLTPAPSPSAN